MSTRQIRCQDCGDDVVETSLETTSMLESIQVACTHCGPGRVEVIDGVPCFSPQPPTLRTGSKGWHFVILVLALLSGCGEDRTIRFEAEVTPWQDQELLWSCESAAARWNEASGLLFDCSSVTLEWETSEELGEQCRDGVCYQRGGQAREGIIAVHEQLSATLDEIMLHEVGHQIARSGDHPGEGSAMYAFVTPNAQINAADLEWLCASAECTRFQTEEE